MQFKQTPWTGYCPKKDSYSCKRGVKTKFGKACRAAVRSPGSTSGCRRRAAGQPGGLPRLSSPRWCYGQTARNLRAWNAARCPNWNPGQALSDPQPTSAASRPVDRAGPARPACLAIRMTRARRTSRRPLGETSKSCKQIQTSGYEYDTRTLPAGLSMVGVALG